MLEHHIIDLINLNAQRPRESHQAHKIRLIKVATELVKNGGLLSARELAVKTMEEYPKCRREFTVLLERLDEAMGL